MEEVIIINVKTMKCEKAKCHKDNIFDIHVGMAIAWAKYNGESISAFERAISRDLLKGGDIIRNLSFTNPTSTFIGWLPVENEKNDTIKKWAAILREDNKLVKAQIEKEVVVIN